ncbi:MAG: DUF1835 domain-containing protein [Cognaticolwellia sp.]
MKYVHILNGDSLKQQLAGWLTPEAIVMRECLIDGNIQGETLNEFYKNRAEFTSQYQGCTVAKYFQIAAPEIDKIANLAQGREIICWFEDDLFCQANFWFVIHLLVKQGHKENLFLVRPSKGHEYSFAGMTERELQLALAHRQRLLSHQLAALAKLWPLYQQNDCDAMLAIASELGDDFVFLTAAIVAHQARMPDKTGLGYPERQLLAIMAELNSQDFTTVFRCFSAREGIYSFGDLQVKQMFDRLLSKQEQ